MHIHLDPVGGIAGDMFVAAMLDCWPELASDVIAGVRAAGLADRVHLAHEPFNDGVLSGSRFVVTLPLSEPHRQQQTPPDQAQVKLAPDHQFEAHVHDSAHCGSGHGHTPHSSGNSLDHEHVHWGELRQLLQCCALPDAVKVHVIGIFTELAKAEAQVHGKDIDSVAFHEVGHWDSIADIVAASVLIDAIAATDWSVGSIPLGSGRIQTAHGELAIPAPATSLLLKGFVCHDDGRTGERVTPTGAAILKYLAPASGSGNTSRILRDSGFGFGCRRFTGISNVLRILVFDDIADDSGKAAGDVATQVLVNTDTVAVLQFDIDDQTGEDLAIALDYLRQHTGVIDVTQSAAVGKKGRVMNRVQVLARPDSVEDVCSVCFVQTTTLGIRSRTEQRYLLEREQIKTADGYRVKVTTRPDGQTAKTEIDDVADSCSHDSRSTARHSAEQQALSSRSTLHARGGDS